MLYTKNQRLMLTIPELIELFECSSAYIQTILGRFNIKRYRAKNHKVYIELSDSFLAKVRSYASKRYNKRAEKTIKILDRITPLDR